MTEAPDFRRPTPDRAEHNAFFPSEYSLSQFTSSTSDLSDLEYPDAYKGGQYKILMVATDERYLLMANGTMFSTGNHPVEMLLPMCHFDAAGFEIDVATLSGNPVKLEMWALPQEDRAVMSLYEKYLPKFKEPLTLKDVVSQKLGHDSEYVAIFIPGGHGALVGIPFSQEVKTLLHWAVESEKFIVSLCHGPAALLAAGVGEEPENFLFRGYDICLFPDSLDVKTPDIGYMPGPMPWFVGEKLQALGVKLQNDDITGKVHQDRRLITGDSPFASNNLGKVATRAILDSLATSN